MMARQIIIAALLLILRFLIVWLEPLAVQIHAQVDLVALLGDDLLPVCCLVARFSHSFLFFRLTNARCWDYDTQLT